MNFQEDGTHCNRVHYIGYSFCIPGPPAFSFRDFWELEHNWTGTGVPHIVMGMQDKEEHIDPTDVMKWQAWFSGRQRVVSQGKEYMVQELLACITKSLLNVCAYIHVVFYICVWYVSIYLYECEKILVWAFIHLRLGVWACVFTFRCALICVCVYIWAWKCVCVCACVQMHMITVLFHKVEENLRDVPKQAVGRTVLPGYGQTRTNMEVEGTV